MFGNNPKRAPIEGDGNTLFVQSIFPTLQGEGPNVGAPSVFLRLGGCNLACSFCDTEFENYIERNIEDILLEINSYSVNNLGVRTKNLVVITGGEPFRQPIGKICNNLIMQGYDVQVETNGTLIQDIPDEVQIVCSPKAVGGKYYRLRPDVLSRVNAFKFVVSKSLAGYDAVPEVGQSETKDIEVFVQPMDQYDAKLNQENTQHALKIALDYGYRFSLQTHKIIGIE